MSGLVLVVDDNAAFRGLAVRILSGWGHRVIEAGTVAEALTQVTEHRPRAAVIDIGLPDGDGFELTQQLAGLPFAPLVVLISTDSAAGNHSAAGRAGAAGFVPKDQLLQGGLRQLLEDACSRPVDSP